MKGKIIVMGLASILSLSLMSSVWAAPGKPYSDEWIKGRIEGALNFNNYFDSTDIDVDVNHGEVNISGTVPSDTEKYFAETVAKRLEGVQSVKNNLKVDPAVESRTRSELAQYISDATTSAAVKTRLLANRNTNGLKIGVETNKGVVTLSGNVSSADEKDIAEKIALATYGTQDVQNQLKIENPKSVGDKIENKVVDLSKTANDTWITAKIRTMLTFSSDFPGSKVDIETQNGKVILKGIARSAQQSEQIAREVEDVVGVKSVSNEMKVRNRA